MFAWLNQRKNQRRMADKLYNEIVEQARTPAFFRDLGVSDSLEGRYEMVVAHLVLVMERLRADGNLHLDLTRSLVERFVTDMDDSMRELGVSDTKVPKKVKQAAAGLVERTSRYKGAMRTGPRNLALAIRANLDDVDSASENIEPRDTDLAIAEYMSASAKALAGQTLNDILSGKPQFASLDASVSHKA